MRIENAKIESTMLGFEDHGIITAFITLGMDGSGISIGGYCLKDKAMSAFIEEVLKTLELEKWESLKGTLVRVKFDGDSWGSKAVAIGHYMKDKWFNPKEVMDKINV